MKKTICIIIIVATALAILAVNFVNFCKKEDIKKDIKEAITHALSEDHKVADEIASRHVIWTSFFGATDGIKAEYAQNLKNISLTGCPADFKDAFLRHIAAWESRNRSAIDSTWQEVLSSARRYDVIWR